MNNNVFVAYYAEKLERSLQISLTTGSSIGSGVQPFFPHQNQAGTGQCESIKGAV